MLNRLKINLSFNRLFVMLGCLLLSTSLMAADGKTLRKAAASDDVQLVEAMLDAGVAVDDTNQFGRTALMNAVENGNILTASVLLSRGANINAVTKSGHR